MVDPVFLIPAYDFLRCASVGGTYMSTFWGPWMNYPLESNRF